MTLDRTYRKHGVMFGYPEGWELTEETREDAVTVTVNGGGAFWSVTLLRRRPPVEEVLRQACDAFREEYDELDDYPANARVGGEPVEGRNLEFVSLELINCVFLRALQSGGVTLFVMAQVTEHEREQFEGVFQAISDSLRRAPDDEILIA